MAVEQLREESGMASRDDEQDCLDLKTAARKPWTAPQVIVALVAEHFQKEVFPSTHEIHGGTSFSVVS